MRAKKCGSCYLIDRQMFRDARKGFMRATSVGQARTISFKPLYVTLDAAAALAKAGSFNRVYVSKVLA